MRSSGGTNFGLPCVVVSFTKAMIACFAGPSFQEDSGSSAARAGATSSSMAQKRKRKLDGYLGNPLFQFLLSSVGAFLSNDAGGPCEPPAPSHHRRFAPLVTLVADVPGILHRRG